MWGLSVLEPWSRTECVGLGRAGHTHHTQDTPALCTWEPSPGAGVMVSARWTDFWQGLIPPAAWQQSPHFCAHLLCSTHTHPSEPLPPTLGWAGVEEKREEVNLHQLDFLPSTAQSWAAVGRSLEPRMGSACFSKRGRLTPMLSRPLLWRSMQTKLSPSEHTSQVLQCVPGLVALPRSYIAEWPEPLRARVRSESVQLLLLQFPKSLG